MLQHRVIHKPEENSIDIGMVIPAYQEWRNILDTLYSIAVQKKRQTTNVCVFAVINNSRGVAQEVYESNKETASLIVEIIRKKVNSQLPKYIQKKIQRIIDSGLHISLVDSYTEKGAPEVCNVWYARDIGTKSLLPYLKSPESVIAHTDADCKVLEKYIQWIETYFLTKNSIMLWGKAPPQIATGDRIFLAESGKKNKRIFDMYNRVSQLEQEISHFLYHSHICNLYPVNEESLYFTPGSHLMITKRMFEKIGGFEHVWWAEDVQMGMAARKLWEKVWNIHAMISTKCRVSDRTEKGHGFGNEIQRKGNQRKLSEVPSHSVAYHKAFLSGYDILITAHTQFHNNKRTWENFVFQSLKLDIPSLKKQDIQELSKIYFKYIGWLNSPDNLNLEWMMPYLFSHLRIIIERYISPQPLLEVSREIDELLDSSFKFMERAPKYVNFTKLLWSNNIELLWSDLDTAYIKFINTKLGIRRLLGLVENFELRSKREAVNLICIQDFYEKQSEELKEKLYDVLQWIYKNPSYIEKNSDVFYILKSFWENFNKRTSPRSMFVLLLLIQELIKEYIIKPYCQKICLNEIDRKASDEYLESDLFEYFMKMADNSISKDIRVFAKIYDECIKLINKIYGTHFPTIQWNFNFKEFEYKPEIIEIDF